MCAPPGSSLHQVWQAVRASSAAPYYLDDFKCGADRCEGLGLLARVVGTCQYSSLLRRALLPGHNAARTGATGKRISKCLSLLGHCPSRFVKGLMATRSGSRTAPRHSLILARLCFLGLRD